jgi:hypothetical protein
MNLSLIDPSCSTQRREDAKTQRRKGIISTSLFRHGGPFAQFFFFRLARLHLCAFALALIILGTFIFIAAPAAHAFCGFYVSKADSKLFNKASQVVLVRDADKTVLTMANDFQGNPKEFAIVIPVPTFLERDQIHIAEKALMDHLDAYTAPRLVEYFDPDPCQPPVAYSVRQPAQLRLERTGAAGGRDKALGVKIEAEYSVGEYDILILSAEQSDGLETWLVENNYKIPAGASKVLDSYIKQKMRFFVARVNLQEQSKLGYSYLRPIQVAYESPKFMLPIRLGTVNANGPQELFIYTISPKGRIETVNYRTVKLPTGMDLPLYIKDSFADFYRAMFSQQVKQEEMRVVFQEYAWDMSWCDPCAADPFSREELRQLGVMWLGDAGPSDRLPRRFAPNGGQNAFVTRLHLRYDSAHFPEDLVFQQTADRNNFQGRYALRHAWKGTSDCPAAKEYQAQLASRQKTEAETLARLTGWDLGEIHRKMGLQTAAVSEKKWYQKIWKN